MITIKHTIIALVEDKPGVLNRVSSLFRRRAFNIESIAVGHAEVPGFSRMTIVVDGTNTTVEQVYKQLYKVVDVIRVSDITEEDMVARELALIKVRTTPVTRTEVIQIVDIFRAGIIDVAPDSLVIEVTGDEDKIDSLIKLLKGFGIRELCRTGRVAMVRGGVGAMSVVDEQSKRSTNKTKTRGEE
ncbi:MAG: acetolactate synthase small subunit [Chloroflexi bacterium]|nr:acetolactate synthase small subunit [Chloroflexota bacterium]